MYVIFQIRFYNTIFPNIFSTLVRFKKHFISRFEVFARIIIVIFLMISPYSQIIIYQNRTSTPQVTFQTRGFGAFLKTLRNCCSITSSISFSSSFTDRLNGNLLSFFCLDVAQGHMKVAPNETRTHSCRFASRAC